MSVILKITGVAMYMARFWEFVFNQLFQFLQVLLFQFYSEVIILFSN